MAHSKKKFDFKLVIWAIVGVALLAFLAGGCSTYNKLVVLDEDSNKAWANVEASYQRRMDLIKNLNETVKGYTRHESKTLQGVTDARAGAEKEQAAPTNSKVDKLYDEAMEEATKAANSGRLEGAPTQQQITDFMAAQQRAKGAMDIYVNAVHEAYPDLKAGELYKDFMNQQESTENRINYAREQYNQTVQNYNVKRRSFPANFFAGMFGFESRTPFQADPGASQAPTVSFDD